MLIPPLIPTSSIWYQSPRWSVSPSLECWWDITMSGSKRETSGRLLLDELRLVWTLVMFFGLTNSQVTFQMMMNDILIFGGRLKSNTTPIIIWVLTSPIDIGSTLNSENASFRQPHRVNLVILLEGSGGDGPYQSSHIVTGQPWQCDWSPVICQIVNFYQWFIRLHMWPIPAPVHQERRGWKWMRLNKRLATQVVITSTPILHAMLVP